MAERVAYYDSADKSDRRRVLELWIDETGRGTLYETERDHPADIWPPASEIARGVSCATFERMAAERGLTSREEGN